MLRADPDGEAALGARCLAHAVAAVPSLGGGDARATRIAGGISNHLFLVERDCVVAHCPPPPLSASEESVPAAHRGVLVRLYGASEPLCHRPSEVELVQLLTARGFGPEVLGVFPDGRVEAFWAGERRRLRFRFCKRFRKLRTLITTVSNSQRGCIKARCA